MSTGLGNPQEFGGSGPATDLTVGSDARGMILRREAATWEGHQAKTAGQILVGDGTDITSVALSGDGTLSSAGALTLADPMHIYSATVNLTAAQIAAVNNGYTLVAGVPGRLLLLDELVIKYTWGTADFTTDVNLNVRYNPSTVNVFASGTQNSNQTFTGGLSVTALLSSADRAGGNNSDLAGEPLVFIGSGAITQGAATGTAKLTVYYRIVTP